MRLKLSGCALYIEAHPPRHAARAARSLSATRKASANARKHGVSFEDASTAFGASALAKPAAASGVSMKQKTPSRVREVDTMRAESDFSGGVKLFRVRSTSP